MPSPLLLPFVTVAALIPKGFVAIKSPSDELLACANRSHREWRVSGKDQLHIEAEPRPERDKGPALPFRLPASQLPSGRRSVLAVTGGYLIGFDAGEWGGRLLWADSTGKDQRELASDNTVGLVALGPGSVVTLHGLNHLGLHRGTARWLAAGDGGAWKVVASESLDSGPQAFVADGSAIYVLTATSLTRISSDRKVTVVQPTRTAQLYPNSMFREPGGALWVGMRLLVLRLTPEGTHFVEQWFAPKGCENARSASSECKCDGE